MRLSPPPETLGWSDPAHSTHGIFASFDYVSSTTRTLPNALTGFLNALTTRRMLSHHDECSHGTTNFLTESDGILIPESEVSIPEDTHDVFENTGDIPSSQLTQRSVVPNSRSANMLSVQAQRIEKECSVLIGEHTLLHELFPPAARLSVLVVSMWATASRRVGCRVELDKVVIKQVSAPKRITSALKA
jgi:hypothetical protein